MIKIRYIHDGTEREIRASGLGDLGWQLDALGCDTKDRDKDFVIVSCECDPPLPKADGVKVQ